MIQAGLADSNAFSLGVGISAIGFVGTVGSWFLLPHFGRRTLYISGQMVMFVTLMILGGLGIPALSTNVGWASGALLLILTFAYDITVGPVCYSLVAELPSTRLRIKTVVLARNVYNVFGIVIGVVQPQFMNPTALNLRGKTCFIWGALNAVGLVWTYFRYVTHHFTVHQQLLTCLVVFLNQRVLHMPSLMSCSRIKYQPVNSERSKSIHTGQTILSLFQKRMVPVTRQRVRSTRYISAGRESHSYILASASVTYGAEFVGQCLSNFGYTNTNGSNLHKLREHGHRPSSVLSIDQFNWYFI